MGTVLILTFLVVLIISFFYPAFNLWYRINTGINIWVISFFPAFKTFKQIAPPRSQPGYLELCASSAGVMWPWAVLVNPAPLFPQGHSCWLQDPQAPQHSTGLHVSPEGQRWSGRDSCRVDCCPRLLFQCCGRSWCQPLPQDPAVALLQRAQTWR